MKNKLQIVWSSIAIISVCACSTPYTQPDAPIKEVPKKRSLDIINIATTITNVTSAL